MENVLADARDMCRQFSPGTLRLQEEPVSNTAPLGCAECIVWKDVARAGATTQKCIPLKWLLLAIKLVLKYTDLSEKGATVEQMFYYLSWMLDLVEMAPRITIVEYSPPESVALVLDEDTITKLAEKNMARLSASWDKLIDKVADWPSSRDEGTEADAGPRSTGAADAGSDEPRDASAARFAMFVELVRPHHESFARDEPVLAELISELFMTALTVIVKTQKAQDTEEGEPPLPAAKWMKGMCIIFINLYMIAMKEDKEAALTSAPSTTTTGGEQWRETRPESVPAPLAIAAPSSPSSSRLALEGPSGASGPSGQAGLLKDVVPSIVRSTRLLMGADNLSESDSTPVPPRPRKAPPRPPPAPPL
jgi:hypothetical protein